MTFEEKLYHLRKRHGFSQEALAGIVVCLAVVGINEMYFNYFLSINWETMYLMSEAEMRHGNVFYMILVGVCVFVTVFCAGVYWSYAVLLRNQSI